MKSKKLSLLLLIMMTVLTLESALDTPFDESRFSRAQLTSSLSDANTPVIAAPASAGNESIDNQSISVVRMQQDFPQLLAPRVYVENSPESTLTRLLSAPKSLSSTAVLLADSDSLFPKTFQLDVKYLPQNPELPTGCEAVALTSVLNYLGYPVSKFEIVDEYLPTGEPGLVDPATAFPGSPYSAGGFGCYAPAIVQTANDYFAAGHFTEDEAIDISGLSVPELCINYLYRYKRPVVFWASINMVHITTNFEWTIDGKTVPWRFNTHCLALIGWKEDAYIFADPLVGIVAYNKQLVEEVYAENMKNAVFIMPSRFCPDTSDDRHHTSLPESLPCGNQTPSYTNSPHLYPEP